jgi:predicted DNA binding protein
MRQEDKSKLIEVLSNADSIIREIEEKTNSYLIVFICRQSITQMVSYKLNKVLRKLPKDIDLLDVFCPIF